MSKTKQTDPSQIDSPPLSQDEIKAVEDFRASDNDILTFGTTRELFKWLDE